MTNPVMKRRAPILDGRLSAAMDLAEGCLVFADIGADHGRLSTVMLLRDERRYGLVADISALALEKARVRITRMGLADRVTFAVSDGLSALEPFSDHQPDTIFILGMGGETVSGILQRGFNQLRGAAVILGAQTELPLVADTVLHRLSHSAGGHCQRIRTRLYPHASRTRRGGRACLHRRRNAAGACAASGAAAQLEAHSGASQTSAAAGNRRDERHSTSQRSWSAFHV